MSDRTVTVQVEGAPEDRGHIRLSEFTQQLEAVKAALRETERLVSGSETPVLYYRIIDVKRASPFTVVIEAVPYERPIPKTLTKPVRQPDYSKRTVDKFFNTIKQVKKKKIPGDVDLQALQAFKGLTTLLDKHITGVTIRNSQDRIAVDKEFRATIEAYIGPDEIVEGSITGLLEKVNFHNTHRFAIFPTVGPRHVECDFEPELRKKVKEALDNYVRVYGSLKYKWLSPFPYGVRAKEIEIYPPEEQLPTIFDLKGIAPNLTGGVSSEEFVEKIRARSEW